MKFKPFQTAVSALLTAALAVSAVLLPSARALRASAASVGDAYSSYFSDVYPQLTDDAPVFQAITYSKLHYLLQQDGNYIILWGGKTSAALQKDIPVIDSVAKEYGISTIYNFDPKLDGGADGETADIEGTSASTVNYAKQIYGVVFGTLYPSQDPGFSTSIRYTDPAAGTQTVEAIPTPTLLIYNKGHKDASGKAAPVIASLSDTSASGNVSAAAVEKLFDTISTASGGKKTASYSTYSDTAFFTDAFNHQGTINGDFTNTSSKAIFDSGDAPLVFRSITYDELTQLLRSKGNYILFFGGSWCPNTRAAIKWINQEAKKYHISTVYNFDTHLDDNTHSNSDPLNIRTNTAGAAVTLGNGAAVTDTDKNNTISGSVTSPISNLYVNLVNNYLPNLLTEYGTDSDISYTDAAGGTQQAWKLQVPFVFLYDKDNANAKGAAPILRENVVPATGSDYPNGVKELMYSWATAQPSAAPESGNTQNDYTTETHSLDALYQALDVHLLAQQYAPAAADPSKYTAASYQTFKNALADALATAGDYSKSAAQILAAENALTASYNALKPVNAASSGTGSSGSGSSAPIANPNTGDSAPLAAVLLAVSAAAVALAVLRRRHAD